MCALTVFIVCSIQHERELLEREIKFLEAQREFLQFKANTASAAISMLAGSGSDESHRFQAEHEKHNFQVAMRHKAMLANLAVQQQKSVQDLELLLLQSPLNNYVRHIVRCPKLLGHVLTNLCC